VRVVHVHRIGGIGGSERHLLTLLPALAERGLDVHFLGLDLAGEGPEPFYRELAAAGIEHERFPAPRDFQPFLAFRLMRAVFERETDLLHTHLVHADLYGGLVTGTPLVSTKHNDDPFKAGKFKPVEQLLGRRARRMIAISGALKRFAVEQVELPAEKIDVVHYGLDKLPQPWGENPSLDLSTGARVLLIVGRLAEQKGVDVAIRALPAIRARHRDAALLVVGEGPERTTLEALAKELGVSEAVYLPGRVGDVAALYRAAEIVVHPVRWEGFGLALLEAMLAARPVVASAVSSAPEIIADGETGVLVPPDDPRALAEAVASLLDDRARGEALGRAGAERARSEFSVARMAERTLEVYDRALGGA
jgi:glycosyltransferase involved in cell wall biosynthesis